MTDVSKALTGMVPQSRAATPVDLELAQQQQRIKSP
jgi:hypothetical protein